ncbi:collagenase [Actinoallomurus acanthiterrae]
MRHRTPRPSRTSVVRFLAVTLIAGLLAALTGHGMASAVTAAETPHASSAPPVSRPADLLGTASERDAVRAKPLTAAQQPPARLQPSKKRPPSARPKTAAQSCTPADFGRRSGSALADYVRASTHDCINTLFGITGTDAHDVFRQAQMVAVANAFQAYSRTYPGDDSTGVDELIYFMWAGYYVQENNASAVGPYDSTLTAAVQTGLDAFFAGSHSMDVSSGNGAVLGDAVILTDSANLQGRYLGVYKRILNAYNSSWDAVGNMDNALNSVYTPLWRGNWNPDFVAAVTADPSVIDTLYAFARYHLSLLGGPNDVLDSNAGNDLARLVEHTALHAKVRPLAKSLLGLAAITGPTASLWVHVAYQANSFDQGQCSYYGVCDLTAELTAASLPHTSTCDSQGISRTILAQALSAADMAAVCTSLRGQDPYYHGLVRDNGPIPGQYETNVRLAVFATKADYATYSWAIFGNSTDNGGETLTGNITDPNNKPVSVMYQKPGDDGFVARVWNLNHEYTHLLQSIYDMKGTFEQQTVHPDIWWVEGQAEYVSYSYRGITDTEAVTEAAKHTYKLSTLWQTTYGDITRTYPWGYLAARYMFEKHPADIYAMLAHFRTGDYDGGYAVYNTGIGTRYDADFDSWLNTIAGGTNPPGGCPSTDTRALGQNCTRSNQSAATGQLNYFYIYLPAGTVTLHITATGGTGNADLYYNAAGWATPTAYTAKSTNPDNTESITVTNTAAGYRYISLYAATAYSGVSVTTTY